MGSPVQNSYRWKATGHCRLLYETGYHSSVYKTGVSYEVVSNVTGLRLDINNCVTQ